MTMTPTQIKRVAHGFMMHCLVSSSPLRVLVTRLLSFVADRFIWCFDFLIPRHAFSA